MNIRKEADGQISMTAPRRYWSSLNEILDLVIAEHDKLDYEKTTLEPFEMEALLAAWQTLMRKALRE